MRPIVKRLTIYNQISILCSDFSAGIYSHIFTDEIAKIHIFQRYTYSSAACFARDNDAIFELEQYVTTQDTDSSDELLSHFLHETQTMMADLGALMPGN